jgi:murein DD-endopeptidase MepM/ murein hydrolase activator NlpD
MNQSGFLVKIIPTEGYSVYRMKVTRGHLLALLGCLALVVLSAVGVHTFQLRAAQANIAELEAQKSAQQQKLDAMDAQTRQLQSRYAALQRQTDAIWRLLGADKKTSGPTTHAQRARPAPFTADVQTRLRLLATVSAQTSAQSERLASLARRVLNLRRMASIARERLVAAIPSMNPVEGAAIASGFGSRVAPWPEFHRGVDLAVDYGSTVRATGAGTVVSAGWDGGYGIKVDIDHGNGYHTWYCHLSRARVSAGERVVKGEPIAFSGSTGESTGPHLHYQVMLKGEAVDPAPYLTGVPPSILATLPDGSGV